MNTFFALQQEINTGLTTTARVSKLKAIPLLIRILLRGNNEQYFSNSGYQEIMYKYIKVPAEKRRLRRNKSYAGFIQLHNTNSAVYLPYLRG